MTSVIFLFIPFLLLNGVKSQTTAKGLPFMSSIHEGIEGSNDLNEIENILDLLKGIPSNDSLEHNQINELIKTVSRKLDTFAAQIYENKNNSLFSVKSFASIRSEVSRLSEYKKDIKERYNQMKDGGSAANSDMKKLAEWSVLSGFDSIRSKLFNIFDIYLGYLNEGKTKPLLDEIARELKYLENFNHCLNIPAQQLLYNEFLEMRILTAQAYLVNKFSWVVLSNSKGQNFIGSAAHQESVFSCELKTRFQELNTKFREAISDASRELRTCDPFQWKENTNYAQLTRLVQGFIANEATLNDEHRCTEDCGYYKNKYVPKCYNKDPFCHRDRGIGKILTCESVTNHDHFTYCPSADRARRYDYFQVDNVYMKHHFYGRKSTCKTSEVSLESWLRGFVRCSYCFCLLDDNSGLSDRFINLREVISDIEQNKVVTGLRFTKVNRVIYLQIQQGVLAPLGLIRKNTTKWKNVEQYALAGTNERFDYFVLDADHKSVNLDDIQTKNPSYVVTGIKFDITADLHLHLKVRLTKFNFHTGMLFNSENNIIWVSNNWSHNKKLPLTNGSDGPKVSTTSPKDSVPTENTYDYVEFTHSSKRDDAAQTTVPFFDTQGVYSYSPAPLSGVGLYHRGTKGYGGFLAPKIHTLDVSSFV